LYQNSDDGDRVSVTLVNLNCLAIKSRMGWWHIWRKGARKVLVGKPEGKRLLGIPRCRQEDNIKMDFKEIGWHGLDSSGTW
jgi:hypothetical protein